MTTRHEPDKRGLNKLFLHLFIPLPVQELANELGIFVKIKYFPAAQQSVIQMTECNPIFRCLSSGLSKYQGQALRDILPSHYTFVSTNIRQCPQIGRQYGIKIKAAITLQHSLQQQTKQLPCSNYFVLFIVVLFQDITQNSTPYFWL